MIRFGSAKPPGHPLPLLAGAVGNAVQVHILATDALSVVGTILPGGLFTGRAGADGHRLSIELGNDNAPTGCPQPAAD